MPLWFKSDFARFAFLAGFALLIFASKLAVLQTAGSDLPIHDQWDAEAAMTLRPWLENELSVSDLLHPHNEHRLVTTKLYALTLVALNGQWDNLVATIGSAFVHTFCAVLLLFFGRRVLPPAWHPAFALLLLSLFALPFAWANILVGFQIQFYFLVLFTLGHLFLSLGSDRFTPRWALGQFSAVLALLTLASGFFSSIAVLVALAHRAWFTRKLTAQQITTAAIALVVAVLGFALKNDVPGHAALKAQSLSQFLSGLLHLLAWPGLAFFPWSLVLFVPAALFLFHRLRSNTASFADSTLFALLVWFLLQSAATAYARGNGDLLASRYLDLVAFGPLLGFIFLVREWPGRSRRVIAALWLLLCAIGLYHQTRGLEHSVLQPEAVDSRRREEQVRAYLETGDRTLFDTSNPWDLAYPNPKILQQRLSSPTLQRILPASVRRSVPLASAPSSTLSDSLSPPPYPVVVSTSSLAPDAHPFTWRSPTQSADTLPILRFRVAGDFGPEHPNLEVVIKSASGSVPLTSDRSSPDRWKTVNVLRPPGEWWIEVTDADPSAWFALTEPVEVGRLSWLAGKLLKLHPTLSLLGTILLLGSAIGLIWPHRTHLLSHVASFNSSTSRLHFPSVPRFHPPRALVLALLGLTWALLSLNLFYSVALFQPNVLASDQWDFFAPLFAGGSAWDLFHYQHGPHRQGIAFVFTSWILDATCWDARADSLWVAALLSASALLALNLKRKLAGPLCLRDAWIPVVALSLGQFEALLITPNASHSAFPLFLLLLIANIWLTPRLRLRYFSAAVAAIFLTFTGFGLFAGAVLTALLLAAAIRASLARDRAAYSFAASAAVLAIGGWILFVSDYRFVPAVDGFRFPWTPLSDYARFILLMLASPAGLQGATLANYLLGSVLAILLLTALFRIARRWLQQPSPAADVQLLLLASSLLFVANTAVGRVPNGIEAGMSSRYLTLLLPLWLAAYFAASADRRRVFAITTTLALWALALLPFRDLPSRPLGEWPGTAGAADHQYAHFNYFTSAKAAWVDTYLKTGDWRVAQAEHPNILYPDPAATHMPEKLAYLRAHRLLFFAPGKSFLPYLRKPPPDPSLTSAPSAAPDSDTHTPSD